MSHNRCLLCTLQLTDHEGLSLDKHCIVGPHLEAAGFMDLLNTFASNIMRPKTICFLVALFDEEEQSSQEYRQRYETEEVEVSIESREEGIMKLILCGDVNIIQPFYKVVCQ